jgi:hypothetical protein
VSITIKDVIKALVVQGVRMEHRGIVTHFHCSYCNSVGWEAEEKKKKLQHKPNCFVQIATEWLNSSTDIYIKKQVLEAIKRRS